MCSRTFKEDRSLIEVIPESRMVPKKRSKVELEFFVRDCRYPFFECCVYLLAITVGLIQLDEVLVLNLPTKGIVLGDTT